VVDQQEGEIALLRQPRQAGGGLIALPVGILGFGPRRADFLQNINNDQSGISVLFYPGEEGLFEPFANAWRLPQHQIQGGEVDGHEHNPIFYVSKSPWNLYDLLLEFLDIHGIPVEPLFLRDFGLHLAFAAQEQQAYKLRKIVPLLDLYDPLPLILIGDSGEQDPEIYTEVVRLYPQRIRAIYIRNVSTEPQRIAAIQTLATALSTTGCQLVLVPDSASAAAHAAGEGWISPDALVPIHAQKEVDQNAPLQQETLS
jgi:hypothetical protein